MTRLMGATPAALACVLAAGAALAQSAAGPCTEGAGGAITCGLGKGALRVVEGTTSPSGRLAIAWRAPQHDPDEMPDVDSVENHLVRLQDGRPLALTVGRYWETREKGRANHVYARAAWSPDSRWVVVSDSSKWELEAIAAYAVDADGASARALGLLKTVSSAAKAELVRLRGGARAQRFVMDLSSEPAVTVTNAGLVTIPLVFQVPRQDDHVDLLVRLQIVRQGDRLSAKVVSTTTARRRS